MILRFAKAVIKKGGEETLERLSSNVAGLNFLALCTALVPTMEIEEAAEAIQRMLDNTACNKALVPPEYHVQAILELLEPQVSRIGFQDKCYEWDHWLRRHVTPYHDTAHHYPSPSGMDHIVSALRSLTRVGDDDVDTLVVTCYSCTVWIIAFIEWCVGVPPSLCRDSGSVILAQPESRATVLIPTVDKPEKAMKIELFHSAPSLHDAIYIDASQDHEGNSKSYSGMVGVQIHGEQTLQALGVDSELALKGYRGRCTSCSPTRQNLFVMDYIWEARPNQTRGYGKH